MRQRTWVPRELRHGIIIIIIIIIIDPLIQVVRTHQHNSDSAELQTARRLKPEVQRETREIKDIIAEKTKERWQGKKMPGQLPRNLDETLVDIAG
jgi:hypothetical protein